MALVVYPAVISWESILKWISTHPVYFVHPRIGFQVANDDDWEVQTFFKGLAPTISRLKPVTTNESYFRGEQMKRFDLILA